LLAGLLHPHLERCDVFTSQPRSREPHPVPVRTLGSHRANGWSQLVGFAAGFLYFLLHGGQYSIVHGFALSGLTCGAILGARLRRCKTVVKICSIGPQGDLAKLALHAVGRRLWPWLRRGTTFIVPTHTLAPEVAAWGVPAGKVQVIPNAIPAPAGVRAISRQGLGLPEKPVVLFAARLVLEKGIELLQGAWEELASEAILVMVGDGPEARRVSEWAGSRGDVRFFGPQQSMDPFYSAADVFVSPSACETFGNSLAEAMSHGLAVVSTPVGLARHWLRHGENGWIVTGESSAELAGALRRLIEDDALRERLGAAARDEAQRSFSPELVLEEHMGLYSRLMGTKRDA
jgi:glycosyltransferase involved in cell wall biosynthesis